MVVAGNILPSAHGGVGYLQPRGRVSSPLSSSNILQHLKVLHLRFCIYFIAFKLRHLLQSRSKLVETLHFFERLINSFHYVAFL